MKQPPPTIDPNLSPEYDQPQLQLVVHAGPLAGKGFPLTGNVLTFGRDDNNDIVLDDERVSRNHAKLIRHGNKIIIEDLNSTNGTLVNGQRIIGQHILQPVDIISLGSSVFGVKGFSAPSTIGMTQVSPEREPYPPTPSPRPSSNPAVSRHARSQSSGLSKASLLLISGLVALFLTILGIIAVIMVFWLQPSTANIPTVTITAPTNNSQVQINSPVTIQMIASDPNGIMRVELWVGNAKINEAVSPASGGQATLTASFQWTPSAAGTYTLEAKAYNVQGSVNPPTIVTVNAVTNASTTGTVAPTSIGPSATPTAIVPNVPSLVTLTDLNVRGGPSTGYDLLGRLPSGATAQVLGRDETNQWWQIRFDPATNGLGWVSADPNFSKTAHVDNIPIVLAPPTPTGTPTPTAKPTNTATNTPLPPTSTPTKTSIPITFTPTVPPTLTPVPTATNQPTTIEFSLSPKEIKGGECVSIKWNVTGVKEIHFQGKGVGGSDSREDCPTNTTTYRLRIIKLDGSEETKELDVVVTDPIYSSGTIKIGVNQTVDFDKGISPGNDFAWNIENESRKFETLEGVKLAPMGRFDSLDEVSRRSCERASYGNYSTIDGSDNVSDDSNTLVDRLTVCFKTNEGRLGKLRFPKRSTDSIKIEWVTWQ